MKSIFVLLLMAFCCYSLTIEAETNDKKKKKQKSQTEYKGDVGTTITLVTSGTGETKEEATKNALRSALEQTYGTFVSSNSKVVNDELISDEIVSISTGNIAKYEIISFNDSNPVEVTTKAVVSISNLQSYAQNKGMSAELAGNTFAMNLKMEELNKKNQDVALKHLLEQTKVMSQNLFDYEIIVGNPEKTPQYVQVHVTIKIKANNNTVAYYDYFHNSLASIAIEKRQGRDVHLYGEEGIEIDGLEHFDGNAIVYVLRGEAGDPEPSNTMKDIEKNLDLAILNYEIVDNLGNVSGFSTSGHNKEYSERVALVGSNYFYTSNKLYLNYYGGTGRSYGLRPFRNAATTYRSLNEWYNASFKNYHWMNAVRPVVGEKLFEMAFFLRYSVEEIGKISKIEIRPKSRRY